MFITKIEYSRKLGDGDYGSEGASITISPESGDTVEDCFNFAKEQVHGALTVGGSDSVKPQPQTAPEIKDQVEEKPKKETKTKPKKETKPKKSKVIAFNIEEETHKDTACEILDKVLGTSDWDKDEKLTAQASKLFRESLQGKDFMDDKGNVLDYFVDLVKSGMAPEEEVENKRSI